MVKEQLLILISTPLYLLVIGFEVILSHLHVKKYYSLKDTFINIYLCLINGGLDLLFRAVYIVILVTIFQFHFVDFSFSPFLYWPSLFILEDLAFYIARNDSLNNTKDQQLAYNVDSIKTWLANKDRKRIIVKNRLPLYIVYFTCEAKNNKIFFYEDIYNDDQALADKYFANK